MSEPDCGTVNIDVETDIAVARRVVRDVAGKLGFGVTETARIVTAASELGRNVFKYAGKGIMRWRKVQKEPPPALNCALRTKVLASWISTPLCVMAIARAAGWEWGCLAPNA